MGKGAIQRGSVVAKRNTIIFCTVCLALLAGGCGGQSVQPLRVTGGSMAPTLVGEHFAVTCADCGWNFACDAQEVPGSMEVVCPNCGYAHNALKAEQLRPGDGAKLAAEGANVPLGRWQMVMFQTGRPTQPWGVKRIAALPGETWGIRGGDIWINGKIASKTLEEFRAVAIPVYDDDFGPNTSEELPARWQPRNHSGQWQQRMGKNKSFPHWQFTPKETEVAWLDYHHWRCVSSPLPRSEPAPLLDNDSYNQKLSREQNDVVDLLLSCEASLVEGLSLVMQLSAGQEIYRWEWTCDQQILRVRLFTGGTLWAEEQAALKKTFDDFHRLECALVDGQIYAAADSRVLLSQAWANKNRAPTPLTVPRAAIAASGHATTVRHLKLSRDIYYLDPQGLDRTWTSSRPLGPDEFALLGDNAAISVDSRQDAPEGILKTKIRGRLQTAR